MNRLRQLRKERRLTQSEIAKYIGISQNAYSYWENDKVKIDNESLEKLASYYHVTIDYLLGREAPASLGPKQHAKGVWIPVLGDIAAGVPIEAVEDIIDQEEITMEMAEQGEHFGLRLKGDSMEPRMREGDVVIVRRQSDADSGDVCAVMVNGDSATVKRILKREDGIMLIPFNSSHQPMFFSNNDIVKLPVVILGKVVELRAKF